MGPTCQGHPDLGSTGTDSGAVRPGTGVATSETNCTVVVSFSAWEQEGAKPAVGGLRPACIPIGAAGVSVARERRPAKPTRSVHAAQGVAVGERAALSEEHGSVAHWAA